MLFASVYVNGLYHLLLDRLIFNVIPFAYENDVNAAYNLNVRTFVFNFVIHHYRARKTRGKPLKALRYIDLGH